MEKHFLKDKKFIGGDNISIADLLAICEYTQFWMVHIDPTEGYPRIAQWMKDVQAAIGPAFNAVHKLVYDVRDQNMFPANWAEHYVCDLYKTHSHSLKCFLIFFYRV